MGETGTITRNYAMAKAKDLREIARSMDGGADYSGGGGGDDVESLAQRLRQAAFVIEMTAPAETR